MLLLWLPFGCLCVITNASFLRRRFSCCLLSYVGERERGHRRKYRAVNAALTRRFLSPFLSPVASSLVPTSPFSPLSI